MGWYKKLSSSATVTDSFHILTTTLLSLLLPLCFLLLARLTTAHFLFTQQRSSSLLISLFLYTNPVLLQALVTLTGLATLIHGLTGKIVLVKGSIEPLSRPSLHTAWVFLCTLQVCVGLGIEGSIAAGIDASGFGHGRSLLSRVVFFLGLHDTMLCWSRTIVRPVVDDTVFGFSKEERWVERVAMAASFGALWWWKLRDEVESLVVLVEVKKNMATGVGMADSVSWWLYYLTVTIGMVRIVKGIVWVGVKLVYGRVETKSGDSLAIEDKV